MELRPIIVEQTSVKTSDTSERNLSDQYRALRDEVSHRKEFKQDGDYLSNLYNEYYGKSAVNLIDAVQSTVRRRVEAFAKKKKIDISEAAIESLSVVAFNDAQQIEHREIELAFDQYVQQFKNEEAYALHIADGLKEFDVFIHEWSKKRLSDISRVISSWKLGYGLTEEDAHGLEQMLDATVFDVRKKEYDRNRRKIAECQALIGILDKHKDKLSGIHTFIDAAGGAGDLGIATAEHFKDQDINVRIVDVMPALKGYSEYLISNGLHDDMSTRVSFELSPLQEIDIPKDKRQETAIVAKHPCGGLKDDIISLAIGNEVPFLMVMTCCQDKICDHLDTYFPYYESSDIPDVETFKNVLKMSARTNIQLDAYEPGTQKYFDAEKKKEEGQTAMNLLDQVSAKRLEQAGYTVEITQISDNLIYKGNVIIAVKK